MITSQPASNIGTNLRVKSHLVFDGLIFSSSERLIPSSGLIYSSHIISLHRIFKEIAKTKQINPGCMLMQKRPFVSPDGVVTWAYPWAIASIIRSVKTSISEKRPTQDKTFKVLSMQALCLGTIQIQVKVINLAGGKTILQAAKTKTHQ